MHYQGSVTLCLYCPHRTTFYICLSLVILTWLLY
nr:MAG TPA: protein of unknown function (DUF4122) [Caudoviricetes sp.]